MTGRLFQRIPGKIGQFISLMKTTDLIAEHLLELFHGKNWTDVSLTDAVSDIKYKEAFAHTKASPNSIASIVQHLAFWNRVMMARLKGVRTEIPKDNGFGISGLETQEKWQEILKDNSQSAEDLANAIKSFDERKLQDPILTGYPSVYKSLHGLIEHGYYHLGQIVSIKKLSGNP
jgi:uncharacterized damage-inducible protein DinB